MGTTFKKIIGKQFVFTIISIFMGFLVGAIILAFTGFSPLETYKELFLGVFSKEKYIAWAIIYATPLILTGLSVTFAFKTGLFNIGAEGQYIVGSLAAVFVGVYVKAPPVISPLLCIIAGCLAGATLAGISGILKAKKGISEVITSIMLNWLALYFSNYILMNTAIKRENSEQSIFINDNAKINIDYFKAALGPVKINWGIVFAIIMVFVVYYIINKTVLGYRLRAVGYNKNAAMYGGINVTQSIIISMAISGALAGLAGALQVTGVQYGINLLAGQEGYGFNGLSVSMIGSNNPFGVFFAGLFFGGLQYGGSKLNTLGVPSELISIIIGCIMYVIAIPNAFNQIYLLMKARKGGNS